MKIKVSVKKLENFPKDWELPKPYHDGDVGFDLRNANGEIVINPDQTVMINTGLAFAIPLGYEAQLRPRSGLATKSLLIIPNSPGTIDPNYRGEWMVCLHNLSNRKAFIKRGARIAQVVFNKVELPELVEVSELPETKRGTGGYGSTGK